MSETGQLFPKFLPLPQATPPADGKADATPPIYNKVYIRAQSRPLVHGRRKNGDWGIGGQCFFVTL